MTWKLEAFGDYFSNVLGGKMTSFAKYRSFLNRTDLLAEGLDELIAKQGIEGTRTWARSQTDNPFDKFPSDARSIVNSYLGFIQDAGETLPASGESMQMAEQPISGAVFKIEKEMQTAIRKDLGALEAGLVAVDEGIEVTTATGRVDILARDAAGKLTIVELKAGLCPSGAIEQALGYAQALEEERGEPTRAILIASAFNDRHKAAAKRTAGLVLRTYTYQLSYAAV